MGKEKPLLAKITPPPTTGIFPRERLFDRLELIRKLPLVWLNGPPGSGKTSLVSSYLIHAGLPHIWYRTDPRDSDPGTFFHYLELAAKRASARRRKPLPKLTIEYYSNLRGFTFRYFEDFYRRLPQPFVLVLDDYHEVPVDSRLHEVIRDSLSTLPPGCGLIIVSRRYPPPIFTRLQAYSSMEIIGWKELQLMPEELMGIASLHGKKVLSEEEIRILFEKTEGWVTGLILILNKGGLSFFKEKALTGENLQEVFEYFASEIFEKVDAEIQHFLLKTSFLPFVTARMAEELTHIGSAGSILSELNKEYFFTARHAFREPTYQYHALFGEFLQSRASQLYAPSQTSELQNQSARILISAEHVEEAIELYLRAHNWEEAIKLILGQAMALLKQKRFQTLEGWLNQIPADVTQQSPYLIYLLGACRYFFSTEIAREHFRKAFQIFDRNGDMIGAFLAWAGIVDTIIFEWGNLKQLDPWIDWLDRHLDATLSLPLPEIQARVISSLIGILIYRPEHPEGSKWIDRAMKVLESEVDIEVRIIIGINLSVFHVWKGELAKAWVIMDYFKRLTESAGISPFVNVMYRWAVAEYNWFMADSEECLRNVSEGLKLCETTGFHIFEHLLFAQGAHGALTAGDLPLALDFLEKMRAVLGGIRRLDISNYHYISTWYHLLKGDMLSAKKHAQNALSIAIEVGIPFHQSLCHLGMAQAFYELWDYEQAQEHIHQAISIARDKRGEGLEGLCLFFQAYFVLARGNPEEEASGLEILIKGLEIIRKQAAVNLPYWRPSVMSWLCLAALRAGIEVDFVRFLIKKRNLVPKSPFIDCENWPYTFEISTLGGFQILKDGSPIPVTKKAQHKPLELLKALLSFGGQEVSQERLADTLWPETEGDTAHQAFDTTLHRLRKLLGHENVLVIKDGKLSLSPFHCLVDVWLLEDLMGKIDHSIRERTAGGVERSESQLTEILERKEDQPGPDERIMALCEKILALYKGKFLAGEDVLACAVPLRERLHPRLIRQLMWFGRYYEQSGNLNKAVELYLRALEIDHAAEVFYQRLMVCYQNLGCHAEAVSVYQRCKETLAAVLGLKPSFETEIIYQKPGPAKNR